MTTLEALQHGLGHQQAGRMQEAERVYRQILTRDQANPDALHLLGMVAFQTGRLAEADGHIRHAIELRPTIAQFHNNLGNVQLALGQLQEAILCYRRAVQLAPDFSEARVNLASVMSPEEACRKNTDQPIEISRATMLGTLVVAKTNGFEPGTVFDVGAAHGTDALFQIFPKAWHVLIEPQREFEAALGKLCLSHPAEHLLAAAGKQTGQSDFFVRENLYGSSCYQHISDPAEVRQVPTVVIDGLVADRRYQPPFLLKIDGHGSELDVLEGARQTLKGTGLAIIEVNFFEFYQNGPLAHQIVAFMANQGFAMYDVVDLRHRPLDHAVAQADLVFAPMAGVLRRTNHGATAEQAAAINKACKEAMAPYLEPGPAELP